MFNMLLPKFVQTERCIFRLVESSFPAAKALHTTGNQHNSNRVPIARSGRGKFERTYPVLLVRPDGSTIRIQYKEPKRVLQVPLDISTLPEEERKLRLKKRQPKKSSDKSDKDEFEDDFKVDDYRKFFK